MITEETRRESNETLDRKNRYKQVIECFNELGFCTVSDVCEWLRRKGYTRNADRNNAAPRITELCKVGVLEPVGKTRDSITGRSVAVFTLAV